jgi:hypothetical protein
VSFPALALAVDAAVALDRRKGSPTLVEFTAWCSNGHGDAVVLGTYSALEFFAPPSTAAASTADHCPHCWASDAIPLSKGLTCTNDWHHATCTNDWHHAAPGRS